MADPFHVIALDLLIRRPSLVVFRFDPVPQPQRPGIKILMISGWLVAVRGLLKVGMV